jgi:alanine racemase
MTQRAVCLIDLDALVHNLSEVRRVVGPRVRICAVVKSNAYGHGSALIAKALIGAGVDHLAVATFEEARTLRRAGVEAPILLLSGLAPVDLPEALDLHLTTSVWDGESLRELADAVPSGKRLKVHLKVDTGMRRLGSDDLPSLIAAAGHGGIEVEGLFSHLACADDDRADSVALQRTRFDEAIAIARRAGCAPRICHLANSAGLLASSETHYDMVRPGLALYGCSPLRSTTLPVSLRPVMEFRTRVLHLKTVPEGVGIGYGWSFRTRRETRLAILAVGYGQGYPRALSNRGHVGLEGGYAPVVGNVSMDHIAVDVTDLGPVKSGAPVTLWGGTSGPDVMELAESAGTIGYELLTRVPDDTPRLIEGEKKT